VNRLAPLALLVALLTALLAGGAAVADEPDPDEVFEFDDFPLENLLQYPTWFKKSFLDLPADLEEAKDAGKRGIIVYFGQKRCAYCKMLMDVNFKLTDIVTYTRQHFDVVPVDIWSPEEMTDTQGNELTQRQFALRMGTNFTPSLLFYDTEGKLALRLRGYYPPYQFRAALEYVAGGHYNREPFAVYMARGDATQRFEKTDLNEQEFFIPPPHNLDRSRFPGQRPLVVFFEQGDCHACDVLHTQPLRQPTIHKLFDQFDSVQLDMWSDQPVITPDGRSTTARQWAEDLGLFYAPSILFFDEQGEEIIRVDSVVRFFRLRNVLNYVVSKGYKSYPDFQSWRVNSGL
jgi:thioredoxin-related protein